MNVFLVVTVTVALFLYGCYVMSRLDAFSSKNKSQQPENLFRVAVEYTGLENAVKTELEKLVLQYPDYHLLVYGETKQSILERLKRDEAEIALLSGVNRCPSFRCLVREYQAQPPEGSMDDPTAVRQEVTVVWNQTGNNEMLTAFISLLTDGNS